MKIAIFCTGGTKLGYGHLFRSKTFAKAAPDNAEILLLPLISPDDKHIFKELSALTKICLDESDALKEIIRFKPDVMVFDTVDCSEEFFNAVKLSVPRTVSISPVFRFMNRIDILFTRNSDTPEIENVKIYKGLQYAIFNENCYFIPDEIYYHNLGKTFLTVGIAMGGGDAPNKTLSILKAIAEIETPCMFWVLLGEGYKHSYQDLVNSIRKNSNHEIILAKTNRSMWSILGNCSLAIFAGGLTTLESIYAGLPTLNIFEKPDHLNATGKQIFAEGIAEDLGLFSVDTLNKLKERICFLHENKSHLLKMRERSKGKVDKLGALRIHDALINEFKLAQSLIA